MVVVPSITLCLANGMQRFEHTENTKNVDDRNGIGLEMKGQETDAEQVETISHEGAVVEGEIVGDDLYDDLHGENGSEEVVEVAIARRVSM